MEIITTREEVGRAIAFLAADDAAKIAGGVIRITGGTDLATFEKSKETDKKLSRQIPFDAAKAGNEVKSNLWAASLEVNR